ncbi:MAG: hypothetical protein ACI4N4_01380 [Candidatus Fimenecus sp.]
MQLQEYIRLYLEEKDGKYLTWFLHYYEPILNNAVKGYVQEYAIPGHFADLKSACVFALIKALQNYDITKSKSFESYYTDFYIKRAVHEYVRTMRTGYTVPTEDEDARLRKIMVLYRENNYRNDNETIAKIASELHLKPKTVSEIISAGIRNMNYTEFYKNLADDESEVREEEYIADSYSDPLTMLLSAMRKEAVHEVFSKLNYEEQYMVAGRLGFCMNCFSSYYIDKSVTDKYGNPRKVKFKKTPYIDLAYAFEKSSPDTAYQTVNRAYVKMREWLKDTEYFKGE